MYKITVRQYMTKPSTPEFNFMAQWNNNNPMPLRTMVGDIIQETRGMYFMRLHGDITERTTRICMKCGRELTNPVSQFFGIGPECGGHGYVNPFDTEEELQKAVEAYKKELNNITWTGWVIKSAITEFIDLSKQPQNEPTGRSEGETNDLSFDTDEDDRRHPRGTEVHIRIDTSILAFSEQSMFLSFPYNTDVIDIVRGLRERYWNKRTKEWEVPVSLYDELKEKLSFCDITEEGEIIKPKKEKTKAQAPKNFTFKTEPYEHQVEGFNYGLTHTSWLLGDEQGLGKTKQVIDIAVAKKLEKGYKHCLIICGVNGLKWNWVREIATHSDEGAWILGQKTVRGKTVIGSNNDKLEDALNLDHIQDYFIITNIESLRSPEIAQALEEASKRHDIGLIAIDEIHKCKNPQSQQSKGMMKLNADYKIAMTGTPLMNNPLDLYIILKWLGYEKHAFYSFKNHYCNMGGFGGYQIVGYKNLPELQNQLNSIMLRRLKAKVLDLPEKMYVNEFVEMTPKQEQIYREVSNDIQMNIDKIKASSNPLAELIRLRQATGYTGILSSTVAESAKFDRCEELIEEAVENNRKVVVFSNWTQITNPLVDRLRRFNPVVITGETKDADRQFYVQQFQEVDSIKVAIGTTGAMGTGITLTAGTVVIFLDEPWTNAAKEQAIDRCHRIGTSDNITIYTIMVHNSIDERIHSIVEQKGEISDFMVDGKDITDKARLVDFLLS